MKASGRVVVVREVLTGAPVLAVSQPWAVKDAYGGVDPIMHPTRCPGCGEGGSWQRTLLEPACPVCGKDPCKGGGGTRGEISEFSPTARRRLLEVVARFVAVLVALESVFSSLTYAQDVDGRRAKRDLDVLQKRLARAWPDVCGLWVLEFQRRRVIHFHLLLCGFGSAGERDEFIGWLSDAWIDITGDESPDELCGCRECRAAGSMLSSRRAHGVITNPVTTAGELVNYLTGEVGGRKTHQRKLPEGFGWVGRWWGYIDRSAVQDVLAPRQRLDLEAGEVARRLGDIDRVMRPGAGSVVVGSQGPALVTWPSTRVRHHGARYLVSGEVADLLALREALGGVERLGEVLAAGECGVCRLCGRAPAFCDGPACCTVAAAAVTA